MRSTKKKHLISTYDVDLKAKAEEFDNFFRMFIKKKTNQENEDNLLVFSYRDGFKPMKIEKFLKDS